MRLDKFLADNTAYSRNEVKILLRRGRVSVNGETTQQAKQQLEQSDLVLLDGTRVQARQPMYLMLHKPVGAVSARSDGGQATVLDFITRQNFCGAAEAFNSIRLEQLQIVGRLDKETSGLLFLTDDGDWNHRLTSPRSHCEKCYLATVAMPLSLADVERFKTGILLHGEKKLTLPAELHLINALQARVIVQEGRYHQVRRMFAAQGNRVISLHRESIGAVSLDQNLQAGQYRFLSEHELQALAKTAVLS